MTNLPSDRAVALIGLAALTLLSFHLNAKNEELRAKLAARPMIESHVETKLVRVTGPVRIVEKLVKGEVTERVVYRDPVILTREVEVERKDVPICPDSPPGNKRFLGLEFAADHGKNVQAADAGFTIRNRVDLSAGWRFEGIRGPRARLAVRF